MDSTAVVFGGWAYVLVCVRVAGCDIVVDLANLANLATPPNLACADKPRNILGIILLKLLMVFIQE